MVREPDQEITIRIWHGNEWEKNKVVFEPLYDMDNEDLAEMLYDIADSMLHKSEIPPKPHLKRIK